MHAVFVRRKHVVSADKCATVMLCVIVCADRNSAFCHMFLGNTCEKRMNLMMQSLNVAMLLPYGHGPLCAAWIASFANISHTLL